nr:MAG TPA: hypothetical protein [Caudoviricetes sp.]
MESNNIMKTEIKKEIMELLQDNDVMRTRELKDALQEIYNRNNYPMTAKCTDLQKKWGIQIKRTTRYNKGNSYGVIEFNI